MPKTLESAVSTLQQLLLLLFLLHLAHLIELGLELKKPFVSVLKLIQGAAGYGLLSILFSKPVAARSRAISLPLIPRQIVIGAPILRRRHPRVILGSLSHEGGLGWSRCAREICHHPDGS